jgi:single-stranded DNA-binding protein
MKYGVNRVALVGNVGDEPRVSEREGEAFVANCQEATNQFSQIKGSNQETKADWDPVKEEIIQLILENPENSTVQWSVSCF